MSHPAYIREKAIELRVQRRLSIDEIAGRLALPKTTIYYWVKDIPLARPHRWRTQAQRLGTKRMQAKYKAKRDAAYEEGLSTAPAMLGNPSLRDFVNLYIGEGSKRCRNTVAICNSDPEVVRLGARWIRHLTSNKIRFSLQYHADQDLQELRRFWARVVDVEPEDIHLQRKSNSNQLSGRTWRSKYGVLTVSVGDTCLRSRLQAWMDVLHDAWEIDWVDHGGV